MSEYKKDDITIPIDLQKLNGISSDFYGNNNPNNKFWLYDFVYNFVSNWHSNPDISQKIYKQFQNKIIKRDFDSKPPILFSNKFIDVLDQMIDLKYQESFLSEALTMIYSFYIYDNQIELYPLKNIFIHLKSIFHEIPNSDDSDEIKSQILTIFSVASTHSQETYNFILNLFPTDMLIELLNSNTDFLDSISVFADAYSKNVFDFEESMHLLDLSINIFINSLQIKSNKKCRVLEKLSFNRSLDSIYTLCQKMGKNIDKALEMIYEKEFDILLNQLLQDPLNFTIPILEIILLIYRNKRSKINHDSFKNIFDTKDSLSDFPRIDYTVFISFLIDQDNYKEPIERLILSEKILNIHLTLSKNKEPIFIYIYKKNLLINYQIMIENGPFKLKIATISSLNEIMKNAPRGLMNQIIDIKLAYTLINEIEIDTPTLTVITLKCVNTLIRHASELNFSISEILQYFTDNVNLLDDEDQSVQNELFELQALINSYIIHEE